MRPPSASTGSSARGQEENAFDVKVEQRIELSFGGGGEVGHLAVAGIVDQVIERIALPCLAQGAAHRVHESAITRRGEGPRRARCAA